MDSTGCLGIGIPRNPVLKNFKTVIFTVSAPTLEGLKVNGASDVDLTELRVKNLTKSVKGAGTVRTGR